MSPRKSSTSSGNAPRRPRRRYLGLEVAAEPLRSLSSRGWEGLLRDRLEHVGLGSIRFRLIRFDGPRAVVEVDAPSALRARAAWNDEPDAKDTSGGLATRKTWGTLLRAKVWLRAGAPDRGGPTTPR